MSRKEMATVTILLTPEQKADLEETAKVLDMSVSALVRTLIRQHYNRIKNNLYEKSIGGKK